MWVGEPGVWCARGQQAQEGFMEEVAAGQSQRMKRNLSGKAGGCVGGWEGPWGSAQSTLSRCVWQGADIRAEEGCGNILSLGPVVTLVESAAREHMAGVASRTLPGLSEAPTGRTPARAGEGRKS